MALHQFDYIFAIAMLFAFLDAWNIGANDVANSFASSVSSRSLKYWQAMVLAAICEFLGAVLAGSKVSDAIKNKIIDVESYTNDPTVLMLGMACALVGSSTWLSIATRIGMPVSTTHSIVGAIIGAGIAAKGAHSVHWGWSGVAQIIASWFIAPLIAGGFATIVFLFSKFVVLEITPLSVSLRNAMLLVPCLVFATLAILTMLIVWKGAPSLKLDELSTGAIVGSIFGVAAVGLVIYMVFFFPYYRRKLVHEDWKLKWYDVFRGPIYWFKSTDDIEPMPTSHQLTIDYYEGKRPKEQESEDHSADVKVADPIDVNVNEQDLSSKDLESSTNYSVHREIISEKQEESTLKKWKKLLFQGPKKWPYLLWLIFTHGVTKDVISAQVDSNDMLSGNIAQRQAKSKYYDNKIEYLYSLLQVITAGTMSFAHGSNDIANASGPLSTIYMVWTTNSVAAKSDVPVWVLCYTAAALVIGLWTYGYNIMTNLGNKLIIQSPSRGFAIELGAAVTVVMATQLSIPVSTTQCAIGATVFVGLCNRDIRAVNWRIVTWGYLGWIFTLPVAGLISGLIMGIILNAPNMGQTYLM